VDEVRSEEHKNNLPRMRWVLVLGGPPPPTFDEPSREKNNKDIASSLVSMLLGPGSACSSKHLGWASETNPLTGILNYTLVLVRHQSAFYAAQSPARSLEHAEKLVLLLRALLSHASTSFILCLAAYALLFRLILRALKLIILKSSQLNIYNL
jgi:hypothetical protein